jgi:hypothetical protein
LVYRDVGKIELEREEGMKKKGVRKVGLGLLAWGLIGTAQAALIDRGNGLIYDDVLDVTWLHDANYAQTSGYHVSGRMSWFDSMAWAAGLEYGGYDDWRLPTTAQPDSSCSEQINPDAWYGYGCTGSEVGYMFSTNLGGMARSSILSASDPNGYLDLFDNLHASPYWSGTTVSSDTEPGPYAAWYFSTSDGYQDYARKSSPVNYAWAVRSGDVAVVPVPGTALLLGTGLAGLLGVGRQQRRR